MDNLQSCRPHGKITNAPYGTQRESKRLREMKNVERERERESRDK